MAIKEAATISATRLFVSLGSPFKLNAPPFARLNERSTWFYIGSSLIDVPITIWVSVKWNNIKKSPIKAALIIWQQKQT